MLHVGFFAVYSEADRGGKLINAPKYTSQFAHIGGNNSNIVNVRKKLDIGEL